MGSGIVRFPDPLSSQSVNPTRSDRVSGQRPQRKVEYRCGMSCITLNVLLCVVFYVIYCDVLSCIVMYYNIMCRNVIYCCAMYCHVGEGSFWEKRENTDVGDSSDWVAFICVHTQFGQQSDRRK